MERLFTEEIRSLRLGDGETFRGEGILAVTKALLQSGVSYVGGYQGAPVSHLLDVMVQAREELAGLGVHVEACTNEASACAMLGASINYPARGAVTWKSIVGTNVAADALSNLASAGVVGGALIVVGEDYGEGASVIQERTHAYALKSTVWLADPRPELPVIVRTVEQCFELSEASNTPVMLELRIRACHVQGEFTTRANRAPAVSVRAPLAEPADFLYDRLSHPPVTFRQERLKREVRMPAARRFIEAHGMNERFGPGGEPASILSGGAREDVGIVVQGGLYNNLVRALQLAGAADAFGRSRVPILCLNVVCPLVPDQLVAFCEGRRAVLVVEEGQPEYIEQEIAALLRRAGVGGELHGKDWLQHAGEYTTEAILAGVSRLLDGAGEPALAAIAETRARGAGALGEPPPPRPPTFCVGCPERPVFSAMKLVQQDIGRVHVGADIGCHAFATFEPFSQGNSILGYGMSLASIAGVSPLQQRRPVAVMGDGGFWHNGLLSGVSSNLMNHGDAVLLVMKNGYTSATGTQELVSSPEETLRRLAGSGSATHTETTIEQTLAGAGVTWLRTVHTYRVGQMMATLREALTTPEPGLKVIVAEGECQLERQRRIRPVREAMLARGERVVRVKYGVDDAVCTGDHSCIRLSGCPSLTVRDSEDPLKQDPVAHVDEHCVGCGLCGEVAHAATLCPSFYHTVVVQQAGARERWMERWRTRVRGWLSPRRAGGAGSGPAPAASGAAARDIAGARS